MTREEAVELIRELLLAPGQEELQALISQRLPQMDHTFFAVLTEAAEAESARHTTLGQRLTTLARMLLPLRTLI